MSSFNSRENIPSTFYSALRCPEVPPPTDIHSRLEVSMVMAFHVKRLLFIREATQQQRPQNMKFLMWHAALCSRSKQHTVKYYRFWENKTDSRRSALCFRRRSLPIASNVLGGQICRTSREMRDASNWQRLMTYCASYLIQLVHTIWLQIFVIVHRSFVRPTVCGRIVHCNRWI